MALENFMDLLAAPGGAEALTLDAGGQLCSVNGPIAVTDGIPCLFPEMLSGQSAAQQEHYDRVAQAYSANLLYPHTIAYTQYLDDALFDAAPADGFGDMAEICCGTGEGVQLFAGRYRRAVGVDISLSMLRRAREAVPADSVLFVQGDALNLPLASQSFDAVTILGGIHHIPDLKGLFSEIARILKPGGILIAREPVDDFALWRGIRSVIYRLSSALDAETEHPLRRVAIEAAFQHAGLRMQTWTTHGFLGFCLFMNSDVLVANRLLRFVPGIRAITKAAARFDAWCLSFSWFGHAGTQVVLRATRPEDAFPGGEARR